MEVVCSSAVFLKDCSGCRRTPMFCSTAIWSSRMPTRPTWPDRPQAGGDPGAAPSRSVRSRPAQPRDDSCAGAARLLCPRAQPQGHRYAAGNPLFHRPPHAAPGLSTRIATGAPRTPITDEQGEVVAILQHTSDITELQAMKDSLKQAAGRQPVQQLEQALCPAPGCCNPRASSCGASSRRRRDSSVSCAGRITSMSWSTMPTER